MTLNPWYKVFMGLIMWVWCSSYIKLMLVSSPVIYYLVLGQDISQFELTDWVHWLASMHRASLCLYPFPSPLDYRNPLLCPVFTWVLRIWPQNIHVYMASSYQQSHLFYPCGLGFVDFWPETKIKSVTKNSMLQKEIYCSC